MLRQLVLCALFLLLACNTQVEPTPTVVPPITTDTLRPLPEWTQLSELSGTRLHTAAGQLWLTDALTAGWHSADFAVTWQPNGINDEILSVTAGVEGDLWYAVGRKAFYRSSDAGQTWQPILEGSDTLQPTLAVTNRGSIFVSDGNQCQVRRSRDNGDSWEIFPIQIDDCFPANIVASPNYIVDQTLYVLTAQKGIFVSRDAGINWQTLTTLAAAEFAIDPNNPNTLYLIADSRLYRSHDGGANWEQLLLAPEGPYQSTTVTVAPTGVVYVGTLAGLLFDSADDGTLFRNVPLTGEIETIRSVVFTSNTIFLLTKQGVYGGYLPGADQPPRTQLPIQQPTEPQPETTIETVVALTPTPFPTDFPTDVPPTQTPFPTVEPISTPLPDAPIEDGYPEPTDTPETVIPLEPNVIASFILFDSWSPDERYAAFWTSDDDDLAAQLPQTAPGGILTFYDLNNQVACPVDSVHTAQARSAELFWQADGSVIVLHDDTAYQGQPCNDFVELAAFTPPSAETPDLARSPDGRYRVETVQQGAEDGILTFQTTLYDDQTVLQISIWQIDERLGDYSNWLGGEWVSPTQFVIYETFSQGPLLLDVDNGVVEVLSALFGVEQVPNITDDGYAVGVRPIPSDTSNGYHLLSYGVGLEEAFPPIQLYHAETESVERLPATHLWSTPTAGNWIILNAPDFTTGSERFNLLRRRLEDVDGLWEPFASDVAATLWDSAFEQLVWIQGEETAVWQDWGRGVIFGRYSTAPFWTSPTLFSSSGNQIALVGNQPGQAVYGIFLLAR